MRRRPWGSIEVRDGSIRVRPPGSPRPPWTTLPRGSSRKDAEQWLETCRRKLETGCAFEPSKLTVRQFLADVWLPAREKEGTIAGTLRHYRDCIGRMAPVIGSVRLQALTSRHVETMRDRLKADLAAGTVNNVLNALAAALNWAIGHDLLSRNVAEAIYVKRLREAPHTPQVLTADEAKRLLQACRTLGPPLGPYLACAIATGSRVKSQWGAMRWADVDLANRRAFIQRTLDTQTGEIRDLSAEDYKTRPHWIALPKLLVPFLEEQRSWQRKVLDHETDRVTRIDAGKDGDRLVFTNINGRWIAKSTMHKAMVTACELAGLGKMRIHDLRHSAATLLLALGASPKEVQEVLGHKRLATTMDLYTHVLPAEVARTVELLDGLEMEEAQ